MLDDLGKGGFAITIMAQVFLVLIYFFWTNTTSYISERRTFVLYVAISISSFSNILFMTFPIMQRMSLMLFTFWGYMATDLLYTWQRDGLNRKFGIVLHFAVNSFLLYYGLKIISPNLVSPYF
jgi:hypothetical protein